MHITTKIITFLLTLPLILVSAEAVLELTDDNFDDILDQDQPKLIEFYASWCGHCKNLAPIYEELAQGFEYANKKVLIAKVDADKYKDIGKRFHIEGFPTIKWFTGKGEQHEDYKKGRDLEAMSTFVTDRTGLVMKSTKPLTRVQLLTDRTFNDTVGGSKNVFCAFTAPWCGHCKNLAPTWEQLANTFAHEPKVVIAKVDADNFDSMKIKQEQGISGYPTLKWFPAGSKEPVPYDGGRTEADFIDFVNKEAKTFRLSGGGLTALAGTIPSLDAVVQSISDAGSNAVAKLEEIVAAAKSETDPYAKYYSRVAEKLQKNTGYVEKELKRLQGIIKKGALAPEKLDDLTSRSNILQKFKSFVTQEETKEKSEL